MNTLLIDNGTTLLEKLELLIPKTITVRTWDSFQDIESDSFDLVVLSGGSLFQVKGNEAKLSKELQLLRDRQKPVIGICYGCELMATAFGGALQEDAQAHHGIAEVRIVQDDPIFEGRTKFQVYENHLWRVQAVPPEFVVLAESDHGIEIIKHRSLPLYGFQFHPEQFVDQTEGDEIFLNLMKQLSLSVIS